MAYTKNTWAVKNALTISKLQNLETQYDCVFDSSAKTPIGAWTWQLAVGASSTDGLALETTTAATVGAQKRSPRMRLKGKGWKTNATAASQDVDFAWEVRPVQGTAAPTGSLLWAAAINGGAYSDIAELTSAGGFIASTYLGVGASVPASGAVRIGNNAYIVGKTSGGVDKAMLGISGSNVLDIDIDAIGARFYGTLRVSSFGSGTLQSDASGNISSVSDERLKTSIRAFTRGLDGIRKLTPISHRWNRKSGMETKSRYVGFSAQNVERALGAGVSRNSKGVRSLSDRAIIAALVNAVQQLDAQVAALQGAA